MVEVKSRGDFKRTKERLNRLKQIPEEVKLRNLGAAGVRALKASTPKDTGELASSWYYEIEKTETGSKIVFANSKLNKGLSIALLVQNGHADRAGAWVEGYDYINPALKGVVDSAINYIRRELSRR